MFKFIGVVAVGVWIAYMAGMQKAERSALSPAYSSADKIHAELIIPPAPNVERWSGARARTVYKLDI